MFPDGAVLKGAVLCARTRVARRSGEREDGLLRVPVPCVLKALPSDDVHVPYLHYFFTLLSTQVLLFTPIILSLLGFCFEWQIRCNLYRSSSLSRTMLPQSCNTDIYTVGIVSEFCYLILVEL